MAFSKLQPPHFRAAEVPHQAAWQREEVSSCRKKLKDQWVCFCVESLPVAAAARKFEGQSLLNTGATPLPVRKWPDFADLFP